MQGLCSSTAGVGVHAAGSERKQWLREDPCGAAQLDNRSVRGGPAVFARLLGLLVSYRSLGRRVFSDTRHATEHSLRDGCDPSSDLLLVFLGCN